MIKNVGLDNEVQETVQEVHKGKWWKTDVTIEKHYTVLHSCVVLKGSES